MRKIFLSLILLCGFSQVGFGAQTNIFPFHLPIVLMCDDDDFNNLIFKESPES